jgi:hypothetical protein
MLVEDGTWAAQIETGFQLSTPTQDMRSPEHMKRTI